MLREATLEDLQTSRTLQTLLQQDKLTNKIISYIDARLDRRERLCDLGCGCGFIPYFIGHCLCFKETYGVDINDERIFIASKRLMRVYKVDLETDKLPFPERFFDLVTSFGVLEHLRFFDNALMESYRILDDEGLLLVSIPNLADWVNRLKLFLGLQPHGVVVSKMANGGIDHIHTCTLRTLENLLYRYGFRPLKAYGARAVFRSNRLLEILDYAFSKIPSTSASFFIICEKNRNSTS
ncbi:MAG: class I SAM-dependent methyltransferase [Candidatus Bathyarchaeota archaeon]|nr:class I SAM-dependent methyltransferase [Candidatus Bathyarchaeota archaeon]